MIFFGIPIILVSLANGAMDEPTIASYQNIIPIDREKAFYCTPAYEAEVVERLNTSRQNFFDARSYLESNPSSWAAKQGLEIAHKEFSLWYEEKYTKCKIR